MRYRALTASMLIVGLCGAAHAECAGSNGRGWGSGKGNGSFTMAANDKSCNISFPGFINDAKKTRIPAAEFKVTRGPKSGKLGVVAGQGLVYMPNPGFRGKDTFCTRNTSPDVPGKHLAGCITVTVR